MSCVSKFTTKLETHYQYSDESSITPPFYKHTHSSMIEPITAIDSLVLHPMSTQLVQCIWYSSASGMIWIILVLC